MKTVYFEIFGKKMKTTVNAVDDKQAKDIIISKIKIIKIENSINEDYDFTKEFEKIKNCFK